MSITINGNGTVTGISSLPDTAMATGSVIQVQTGSTETRTEISGGTGTWHDTTLTATITPASSSNHILVMVSGSLHTGNTSSGAITVFRGGTSGQDIGGTNGYGMLSVHGTGTTGGGGGTQNGGFTVLDSPNTDQPTEYLVKLKRVWAGAGGNTQFPSSNTYEKATITLLEIKG
tara:strand:- start:2560 stop:3081 length:522 start_codon:yes stop_codon:yes gene_type:complete